NGKARTAQSLDQQAFALEVYALHLLLGDGDKTLPSVEAKIGPAAASWLAAHAADIRSTMAQAYTLPGSPTSVTANAPAPAMVAIATAPTSSALASASTTGNTDDATALAPDASDAVPDVRRDVYGRIPERRMERYQERSLSDLSRKRVGREHGASTTRMMRHM